MKAVDRAVGVISHPIDVREHATEAGWIHPNNSQLVTIAGKLF